MREKGSCDPGPCAFFDFDDTLVEGDSLLYWFRFYYGRKPWKRFFQLFNFMGLFLHAIRLVDAGTLKRIFFLPMSYENPATLDRMAGEFVREELVKYLYPNVLERLWTHHRLNHRIFVVSASPVFYLRYIREFLPQCSVIIGTRFEFPQRGLLRLPKYQGSNVKGEQKIHELSAHGEAPASGAGCFGYSDHHSDRFLLEYTEFPCCVLPTSKLQRIADPNGWPSIRFTERHDPMKARLNKLCLLLFAWLPRSRVYPRSGVTDLIRGHTSRDVLHPHMEALRERVLAKYSSEEHPAIFSRLFPKVDIEVE
ncbi:MAG: HAD family hydrolase [Acidobacteriota bacterium]